MINVILSFCLLALCTLSYADHQENNLFRMFKSKLSKNRPILDGWAQLDDTAEYSPVYVGPQDGLAQLDKILGLPGQPEGVDFDQYSGYVNIDPKTEKALFYYFVESPQNSSTNPLVLWLNGGPGCSSLIGGLAELGPFRVNSDGKTLFRNNYAWNNVANVIFLESPAGVGFSYANMTAVYNNTGDKSTAEDAYVFLVNWLERFPQYKNRDFYITGESYAGHYVPQLAYTVLQNNKKSNQTIINLKGIAIGNAVLEDLTRTYGIIDYLWTHAMYSDETREGLYKYCNFSSDSYTEKCIDFIRKLNAELGDIDPYNIYAPVCLDPQAKNGSTPGSVESFDPCWETILTSYLNKTEVQTAFHARPTNWNDCSDVIRNWTDSPSTILPIIEYLIANGQRLWVYSGDIDAVVPITASRYSINALKLPIETTWRPWYSNKQVGGYVVGYKGLVLTTVRGAGHTVPSYQPERALAMFSSFLEGTLPPST